MTIFIGLPFYSVSSENNLSNVIFPALPSAPTNLQVSDVTATSAQLSWSYTGPEEIQYYVIQCKPKHANQDFSEISGVITSYYAVRSLSPYTEYEMSVIAVNNIGRGPPSQSVVVTTGETGMSNLC